MLLNRTACTFQCRQERTWWDGDAPIWQKGHNQLWILRENCIQWTVLHILLITAWRQWWKKQLYTDSGMLMARFLSRWRQNMLQIWPCCRPDVKWREVKVTSIIMLCLLRTRALLLQFFLFAWNPIVYCFSLVRLCFVVHAWVGAPV